MEVKITYLYHSCFSLEVDKKVFLYDYPGSRIDKRAEEGLKTQLRGKELYVFISHAHGDHFSPDVVKFSSDAEKTHFILSSDVYTALFPKLNGDLLEANPDSTYSLDDMQIRTFESNDAGVAFLIRFAGLKVYFGGDLAKWDWPEWSEKKREDHVRVFDEVVRSLEKEKIDIAFSNMDERLPSWAGPIEFIERVKPTYFVPIHTFGSEEWIDDLVEEGWDAKTEIFHYSEPGDEVIWKF
ncbi:MAG: MBL fold metallo-hydrolase [Candidatus Aenigmatarchaeota archaeon]